MTDSRLARGTANLSTVTPRSALISSGTREPAGQDRFALRVGQALLPSRGFVHDVVVVVEGEVIAEVVAGPAAPVLDRASVVDASAATLLPGLVDSHVHLTFRGSPDVAADMTGASDVALALRAVANAQSALVRGVTTLADCGARGRTVIEVRDAIGRREVMGPRILAAGAPITTTGGHCAWLGACAELPDDVIREARRQVAAGADFLKIMLTGGNLTPGSNPYMMQYPEEALKAAAAEARRLAKPLVVHAHSEPALALAARCGASIVAHATCWKDGGFSLSDSTIAALKAAGVAVDPTITVGMTLGDPASDQSIERARVRQEMLPIFAEMHRHGVTLLAGTDSGVVNVEHGSSSRAVLSLLRDVGLTLEESLGAATERAAASLGLGKVTGSIRPGLSADLLLVEGDLQDDPSLLLHPSRVWARGRLAAVDGTLVA
jgi:imidazolonepropionase-like amidohydrolase